jgi:UPF0755 protein
MSTPTPENPNNKPNDSAATESNAKRVDSSPVEPTAERDATDDLDKAPATDVSLISGGSKPRRYKKDNPSFFMQRGYQILLVLGLIAAFLLVMVYQTLFGRITQPAQKVTIEQGDTYYGLLPQWQKEIPLFSASIAK